MDAAKKNPALLRLDTKTCMSWADINRHFVHFIHLLNNSGVWLIRPCCSFFLVAVGFYVKVAPEVMQQSSSHRPALVRVRHLISIALRRPLTQSLTGLRGGRVALTVVWFFGGRCARWMCICGSSGWKHQQRVNSDWPRPLEQIASPRRHRFARLLLKLMAFLAGPLQSLWACFSFASDSSRSSGLCIPPLFHIFTLLFLSPSIPVEENDLGSLNFVFLLCFLALF